jgi:hypothetical protein
MNPSLAEAHSVTESRSWAQQVGPLRWCVAGLAVCVAPCAFLQSVALAPFWKLMIQQIMPGIALFMIWAIPLDILMARVFQAEADDITRARYRTVIRFDLAVLGLMLLSWGVFFTHLMLQRLSLY